MLERSYRILYESYGEVLEREKLREVELSLENLGEVVREIMVGSWYLLGKGEKLGEVGRSW